ncbi:MAG: SRPBCC family protein [Vicinamibacterales bacterium]
MPDDTRDSSLDIVSARTFEAPREAVFDAFCDAEQLAHWWGPAGFRHTLHERDLRPGGAWRFTMHGPDGTDYPMVQEFLDVQPTERIVYRNIHPTHGFTMTMTLVQVGERTQLTWRMRFESDDEARAVRQAVLQGNEQNFDRLAAHLAAWPADARR